MPLKSKQQECQKCQRWPQNNYKTEKKSSPLTVNLITKLSFAIVVTFVWNGSFLVAAAVTFVELMVKAWDPIGRRVEEFVELMFWMDPVVILSW